MEELNFSPPDPAESIKNQLDRMKEIKFGTPPRRRGGHLYFPPPQKKKKIPGADVHPKRISMQKKKMTCNLSVVQMEKAKQGLNKDSVTCCSLQVHSL